MILKKRRKSATSPSAFLVPWNQRLVSCFDGQLFLNKDTISVSLPIRPSRSLRQTKQNHLGASAQVSAQRMEGIWRSYTGTDPIITAPVFRPTAQDSRCIRAAHGPPRASSTSKSGDCTAASTTARNVSVCECVCVSNRVQPKLQLKGLTGSATPTLRPRRRPPFHTLVEPEALLVDCSRQQALPPAASASTLAERERLTYNNHPRIPHIPPDTAHHSIQTHNTPRNSR